MLRCLQRRITAQSIWPSEHLYLTHPSLGKPTLSLVDAFNFTQAERRRCASRQSCCLQPVDFYRRSCNCIPRSSTRAGPRSALFSATCGTRRMMPSSSTALVRSLRSALRDHLLKTVQLGRTGLESLLLCFFLCVPCSNFIVRELTAKFLPARRRLD